MDRRGFAGAALLLAAAWPARAAAERFRDPAQHFFQQHLGDLKAELEDAGRAGRRGMLLVFEMDGCPFCEWLHRVALREPAVQDYYRRHFAIFRIDVKGATRVTGFDGREMTESAFAKAQKVAGTPTSVFYDLEGRETARFPGAPRNREEYLLLGEYVAEGHYRTTDFPAWRRAKARG